MNRMMFSGPVGMKLSVLALGVSLAMFLCAFISQTLCWKRVVSQPGVDIGAISLSLVEKACVAILFVVLIFGWFYLILNQKGNSALQGSLVCSILILLVYLYTCRRLVQIFWKTKKSFLAANSSDTKSFELQMRNLVKSYRCLLKKLASLVGVSIGLYWLGVSGQGTSYRTTYGTGPNMLAQQLFRSSVFYGCFVLARFCLNTRATKGKDRDFDLLSAFARRVFFASSRTPESSLVVVPETIPAPIETGVQHPPSNASTTASTTASKFALDGASVGGTSVVQVAYKAVRE
mmetsp:Transcript_32895/g.52459  ORF Transcript_32895/g.52459 Transcript_32895/m.52459 type:complete len:290 (-) Transcript_32895:80-949(-)